MTLQAKIITENSITLVLDGVTYQITRGHVNWGKIVTALKEKNYDVLPDLVDFAKFVSKMSPGLSVQGETVYRNGKPIPESMNKLLLGLIRDGFDTVPYEKFMESLDRNPSYRSREQMFGFVEANKITLTDDGAMVLYKRVKTGRDGHLYDVHTGKINNDIGRTVTMRREAVDDDPNRTCSAGLHVCSLAYLGHFGGDVILLVKVYPEDVVAIPTDYNNSKMRVCKYHVIGQHVRSETEEHSDSSIYGRDPVNNVGYWDLGGDDDIDFFDADDVDSYPEN